MRLLSLEEGDVFRVISIDPGTNSFGIAILDIVQESKLYVRYADTINVEKISRPFIGINEVHGEKVAKLFALERFLIEFLMENTPHRVVSESPYMGRFPAAFGALVECLTAIRRALMTYDLNLPLNLIDPASVKQAIGVNGKSGDKSLMAKAVASLDGYIDFDEGVVLSDLDEHAIDAIAVGAADCIAQGILRLIKEESS